MRFTRSGEAAALQSATTSHPELDGTRRRSLSIVICSGRLGRATGDAMEWIGDAVMQNIPRREFITKGSAAIAGLAALYATRARIRLPEPAR